MYHDTFGSAVGCMGCVPRLALLVTLCLPLGCGAPRVTTEGTHTRHSDSLLSRHAVHTTMQTQSETEEEFLGLYPLPHPTTLQGDSSTPTKLLPLLYYHRRMTRQEGMQSSLRDDSVMRRYETSTHTQLKTLRRGSAVGFFTRVKTFLWGILFTALTLTGLVGYSYWRRRR